MNPQIVTANALSDGSVVYRRADGNWTHDVNEAETFDGEDAAEQGLAAAGASVEDCTVVGPYLIEVTLESGRVIPVRIREKIRAAGPTVGHEAAE